MITSRLSNWRDGVMDMPIDKLAEPDAIAYLLDKTKGKREERPNDANLAKKLVRKLDGLPIALEQAAAYIAYRRLGFDVYLKELDQKQEKVLKWHDKNLINYPKPVLAAWQATEEHLSVGQRSILRLASFLAPDSIPVDLFSSFSR